MATPELASSPLLQDTDTLQRAQNEEKLATAAQKQAQAQEAASKPAAATGPETPVQKPVKPPQSRLTPTKKNPFKEEDEEQLAAIATAAAYQAATQQQQLQTEQQSNQTLKAIAAVIAAEKKENQSGGEEDISEQEDDEEATKKSDDTNAKLQEALKIQPQISLADKELLYSLTTALHEINAKLQYVQTEVHRITDDLGALDKKINELKAHDTYSSTQPLEHMVDAVDANLDRAEITKLKEQQEERLMQLRTAQKQLEDTVKNFEDYMSQLSLALTRIPQTDASEYKTAQNALSTAKTQIKLYQQAMQPAPSAPPIDMQHEQTPFSETPSAPPLSSLPQAVQQQQSLSTAAASVGNQQPTPKQEYQEYNALKSLSTNLYQGITSRVTNLVATFKNMFAGSPIREAVANWTSAATPPPQSRATTKSEEPKKAEASPSSTNAPKPSPPTSMFK